VLRNDSLVLASDSGAIEWWKLEEKDSTLSCVTSVPQHDDLATSVDVLADKSGVVSGGRDCKVIVWDSEQHMMKYSFRGHGRPVQSVACHPQDYNIFLSCGQDRRVLMWDLRKPKPAKEIDVSSMASVVSCIAWQPNTSLTMALGTENGDVALVDIKATATGCGTSMAAPPHRRPIHRIAFSPTAPAVLASVSEDCSVAITDFSSDPVVSYKDTRHTDFVRGLSWSPVSGKLFTCGWDSTVIAHDISKPLTNGD